MNFESAHMHLPPGWATGDSIDALAEPGWGWSAYMLPFIEQNNVYNQIDLNVAIDDHMHEDIVQSSMPLFLCTSDSAAALADLGEHVDHGGHSHLTHDPKPQHNHDEFWVTRSNYSGVFGSTEIEDSPLMGNGAFFANSDVRLGDFTDGTSNTMIVAERTSELGPVSWVGMVPEVDEPFARIVGAADHAPNDHDGHFEDFRSYHPGGVNVVLGDGSTHFVSSNINEEIFQALATRRGGEVVSIFDD